MHSTSITAAPIRLWPGILAVTLQWLLFLAPLVIPAVGAYGILAGAAGAVVVLGWWLFFSRMPWLERVVTVLAIIAGVLAVSPLAHESITNGFMGLMLYFIAAPVLSLALVAGAAASRGLSAGGRRVSLAVAILAGCGALMLPRTDGVTGDARMQLHWRWTKTAEQKLLAETQKPLESSATAAASTAAPSNGAPAPGTAAPSTPAPHGAPSTHAPGTTPEWPGFRGQNRDGIVRGARIATDWARHPPTELWRRPIGPGWSSFAVDGDRLYTQEQRGDEEIVACYSVSTGAPVWMHRDPVRFWESNGGAGPRATPTLRGGRVYAFGATGILNALDAATGAIIWSRDAKADTKREIPGWGFSSSPLVVDDLVVVAVSGTLAAYDIDSGTPRWFGPKHLGSYSSPQLATIQGATQIVVLNGHGATSVAPDTGKVLWEHAWEGTPIVQPTITPDGDILISTTGGGMGGVGTRRIAITHGEAGWTVDERWTSNGLKPYFNDFVVHKGHAFGFDGNILASIDLADGTRAWKGGRYGHGQLVLLSDQDLLIVLSEEGEVALVEASTEAFKELARIPAIEGKTWNHPVLVGDVLLIRNGEEMAAFRLSAAPEDK